MNVHDLGVLVDQTPIKQFLLFLQLTDLVQQQTLLTLVRICTSTIIPRLHDEANMKQR